MSKKTIAGLIVEIGGDTTKLGTALKDIDKQSSDLSKELGEINRLLKMDPGNTELLAQKQKVLAEAISTTGERLKVLKEAEDQVTEAFKRGEASEEELRALQREIVATEKKLNGYEAASRETAAASNAAWKKAKEELIDLGDKASKVAAKGIAVVGAAATAAVAGLVKLAFSSANVTDELYDMSGKTGLSVEQLQKYKYAADMAGTSLETLTGAQSKLTKSMANAKKGTGDTADAFKKLGVNVTDTNGELRKADDVFNDALDALGKVGNETERDALAMQIFGKSAQELNPLIKAGEGALKAFGDEAERIGAVVSEDTLAPLAEMQTEVKKVRAQFDALKVNVGSQFAPVMTRIMQKLQKLLEKAQKTISTPKIREAVKKLEDAVERFLERGVNALIKVLPKLVSAVTWLLEHLEGLVIAFGSLWAVMKAVKVVNAVTDAFKTAKSAVEALRTAALATKTAQEGLNTTMAAGSMAAGGWIAIIGAVIAAIGILAKTGLDAIAKKTEELSAKSLEIISDVEESVSALAEARKSYEDTVHQSEAAADMASGYLKRMQELEGQSKLTADEQREYNELLVKLKTVMPDLNVEVDKETGLLKDGAAALEKQIELRKKRIKQEAGEARLRKLYEEQIDLQQQSIKAQEDYNKKAADWATYNAIRDKIHAVMELSEEEQATTKRIAEEYGLNTWGSVEAFGKAVEKAEEASKKATDAYRDSVEEAERFAGEYIEIANDASEATEGAAESVETLEDNIESMSEAAQEAADTHLRALIDASKNMFDVIDTGNAYTMQQLLENLKKNREAIDNWHENLSKLYARGASSEFVQYLEELGLGYASAVDTIANATEEEFRQLVSAWQGNVDNAYSKGKEWGTRTGEGIVSGVDGKIADIKASGKRAAKALASAFANVLEIKSPSRLFKRFAGFTAQGYINELDAQSADMAAAANRAAEAVSSGFDPHLSGRLDRALAGKNAGYTSAAAQNALQPYSAQLDSILEAIRAGQNLMLDGKRLVGGTADAMDSALGGRVVLGRRTALA